jgi:hypothetical protein
VACVHCINFGGAKVEGRAETYIYRNPKFNTFAKN